MTTSYWNGLTTEATRGTAVVGIGLLEAASAALKDRFVKSANTDEF